MKRFAQLFEAIDQSTKTTVKVAALAAYFGDEDDMDRLWTVALFSGRRPKRAVTTTRLREWAAEAADVPLWLFEDSYAIVGDLAETIARVLPDPSTTENANLPLHRRQTSSIGSGNGTPEPSLICESCFKFSTFRSGPKIDQRCSFSPARSK